jgi:hypothetical protein
MVALKWALTTCWEHFGNIEDPLKLLKEQHDNLLGMSWEHKIGTLVSKNWPESRLVWLESILRGY